MNNKESCASRIKKALNIRDMTQAELCKLTDIPKSAMSQYCAGTIIPRQDRTFSIASALNVSEAWLMGFDVPMDREALSAKDDRPNRIKVYGSVPAGIPIEAVEDIVDWEDIPMDWLKGGQRYIGLRVKGDSMYPKYIENDTIIVRLQPDCESGQDAVVYVNGYDATLKKVIKNDDGIMLQPLNPKHDPKQYRYDDELHPISILGVVVEIRRKV